MPPNEPDLEELLDHVDATRRLAARLVRDPQGADDIAQEALVTGMKRPPGGGRGWRGWLAGIVRNKARESRRSRLRRLQHEQRALRPRTSPSAAELAMRVEAQKRLMDAVMALPETYRTVVWLRFFEERAPRDIARELEVPVETVRTRLRRSLHRLRLALDAEEGGNRRAWQLALLPVPALRPAWMPSLLGGVLMTTKAKWITVAALVVLGLGGLWGAGVLEPGTQGSQGGEGDPELVVAKGDEREAALEGRAEPLEARSEPSGPRVPPPVDLDRADRDLDLHGTVVRAGGTPIAGARLQVVRYPWRYADLITNDGHHEEELGESAWSARDGTFRIPLERGAFVHLRVTAEGYGSTEIPQVQAGERLQVRLHEGVRLDVVVTAPDGSLVSGVRVRLRPIRDPGGASPSGVATTDAAGRCSFRGLEPGLRGMLQVHVQREGWGNPGVIQFVAPSEGSDRVDLVLPPGRTLRGRVTDARTGKPIEGARVGMNWVLEPEVRTSSDGEYALLGWSGKGVEDLAVLAEGYGREHALVGDRSVIDFRLVKGTRVVGRVLGHDGAPVSTARVSAIGSDRHGGHQRISLDDSRTDAGGRFELEGLRRDMAHTLIVLARGHARVLLDVDASPEDLIDVGDVVLPRPCELFGRVLEADGSPVARAGVSLEGANADRARLRESGEPAQTTYGATLERRTDDLGRFRFVGLPPGRYELRSRDGTRPAISETVALDAGGAPVRCNLNYTEGRRVRVFALDEAGKPVAGVYVQVTEASGRAIVQGRTDARGIVDFLLPPRKATARAMTLGDSPYLPANAVEVAPTDEAVTVTMRRAAFVAGRVVGPDAKPIAGARIEARRGDEVLSGATCDAQGRFRFVLPPGGAIDIVFEGRARQKSQGGITREIRRPFAGRVDGVRIGAEDVRLVAKRVADDESLTVRVLDPGGAPVEGAFVFVQPSLPEAAFLKTAADGRVEIETIPALEHTVSVLYPGDEARPWVAPPGETVVPAGQEVTVRLRRGTVLTGTLQGPDGKPFQGPVNAKAGGEPLASHGTDEHGRFTMIIDPQRAKRVTLRAYGVIDGVVHHAKLEDVAHDARDVVLQLARD